MPTLRLIPLALLLAPGLAHAQAPAKVAPAVTYKDHVLPVLRKHCLNCHSSDKAKADLDVSTFRALMTGGASGEAVKPGNAGQSLLYRVTAHEVEPSMPPKGEKIPAADLAIIKAWIDAGAPDTAVGAAKLAARKPDVDPVAVSLGRPSGPPPMPGSLPALPPLSTARPHAITAMAASPWAPLLAVAGHERVLLYHTDTLQPLGSLAFPERIPYVLRFSRNGKWLLAAGGRGASAGRVVVWDVASGRRVAEVGDEADVVLAADISPDHKLVALGGPGKLVKVLDTATGELKYKIKKHTDWVTTLEFSPDGTMLATGDRAGGAYVWEAASGGIVFTLGDHKDAVTALNWRADGQTLASASEDGKVILWSAEDGFPARSFTAQADTKGSARNKTPGVLAVQFARDGKIVTCGRDNTARVWKADGNAPQKLDGFTDLPSRVAVSHDGGRVFVGDFTGRVRAWGLKDGKPAGELAAGPR